MRESDPPLTADEQRIEDAYQADPMEWGSEAGVRRWQEPSE